MLQQDYLMRLIAQFIEAMTMSLRRSKEDSDPRGAAEMLEQAIGSATDIDGAVLLSLAPESIAAIMQVSGVDPQVVGYVAHSLALESTYLEEAGEGFLSELRRSQAEALAAAYQVDLSQPPVELESVSE